MTIANGRLIPAKGKHLKNTLTGKVFGGEIALGKYDCLENYVEVDTYEPEVDDSVSVMNVVYDREHRPEI